MVVRKLALIVWFVLLFSVNSKGQSAHNSYFSKQITQLKAYKVFYKKNENKNNIISDIVFKTTPLLGDSSQNFIKLKDFFEITNDIVNNNKSPFYDTSLQNGIKNFQNRNGLEPTGLINTELLQKIKQPFSRIIQIINTNIERNSYLTEIMEDDFILINIPEFKMYVIENGTVKFFNKVIVGKASTPTPTLISKIDEIILSPYWYVPESIFFQEIIPATKINPNYLRNHRMEYFGKTARQLPGPNNSLGQIKFNFNNTHNVYLHDTPNKNLFNYSRRTFSHGCIRVQNPKELVYYLLKNQKNWNKERIEKEISKNKEKKIRIDVPLCLIVIYFTCWVDENEQLRFAEDIYNKD